MAMNIQRQAGRPNQNGSFDPPAAVAKMKSTSSEMKMPVTIANCCNEPSRPRIRAGAISAMYAGAITDAMPTPRPPINRKKISKYRLGLRPAPIALMKAVKNPVEIEGSREAHRRDGAAVVNFLAWLERETHANAITEIDAVEALDTFRRETGLLKDVSFPTISGSGPNGAIVHYRVTRATNRKISAGELFLIDSGGQYEDGTTDITRTVAIGQPTNEMRERFTLVLKGHIAIATVRSARSR